MHIQGLQRLVGVEPKAALEPLAPPEQSTSPRILRQWPIAKSAYDPGDELTDEDRHDLLIQRIGLTADKLGHVPELVEGVRKWSGARFFKVGDVVISVVRFPNRRNDKTLFYNKNDVEHGYLVHILAVKNGSKPQLEAIRMCALYFLRSYGVVETIRMHKEYYDFSASEVLRALYLDVKPVVHRCTL